MICVSPHVALTYHQNIPSHPLAASARGFLITSGGKLGCVLAAFPFFFLLTTCVEWSAGVITAAWFAVLRLPRVRGAMLACVMG